MDFEIFVTPGLGDNTYLVTSEGQAVLVDPQRDVWRFLQVVRNQQLCVTHVLETHVHNDYVSGAGALRALSGAQIVGPAAAGYHFPHRGLVEGDEVRVGNLRIVGLATPGHTPEHLSYLVFEGKADQPTAIFTGGSVLVGSAGRTDLLGSARTEELTRAQYHSIQKMGAFADELLILPTHGAGSFCSATVAGLRRTSTLGAERHSNPALQAADEQTFVRQQLEGLVDFPSYYRHMAPINRAGPPVLHAVPTPTPLTSARVEELIRDGGVWVVDARDRLEFARAHLGGALNIEMNNTFGTYVGWIVPMGATIVLVLPDDSLWEEAATQLLRIGYDRLAGHLAGGIDAWRAAGRPLRSYPISEIDDLCRACLGGESLQILDVRQTREWEQGHIPEKSVHLFVGELRAHLDDLSRDSEVWTICASGYRAAIAASLLDRAGIPVRLIARGGVPEWAAHCYPQASTQQ